MLKKSSKKELGFVHYIAKFTILRFIILRFVCTLNNFFGSDYYPNKKYENECTKLCAYCIIIRWHYIYFWSWVDSYSFLLATFTMLQILSKKWENLIPFKSITTYIEKFYNKIDLFISFDLFWIMHPTKYVGIWVHYLK